MTRHKEKVHYPNKILFPVSQLMIQLTIRSVKPSVEKIFFYPVSFDSGYMDDFNKSVATAIGHSVTIAK